MIRNAYHMLPITHGLIKVQGVGEDMPSNMFLLSTLNCCSFTEHTFWPSKSWLPKFLQKDSWAWNISWRWDDIPWVLLSFCVNMAFVGEVWETAPSALFFRSWAKPTRMGWVVLLPLKMEVRLIIFFPFRLRVLQWSRHLFNYWNK